MERLRVIWAGGVGGKVLIIAGGLGAFLVFCCAGTLALGAVVARNAPTVSSNPTAQTVVSTQVPTKASTATPLPTPFPSVMSVSTIVAVQPTQVNVIESTVEPSPDYLEIAQKGAIATARVDLPKGEWKAVAQDLGDGLEVQVTFPLSVGFSNEQTVRLGRIQAAGITKRLFDAAPALATVNVIGTLPDGPNNGEQAAISILVKRADFERWDGRAETLGHWNVSQRLQ